MTPETPQIPPARPEDRQIAERQSVPDALKGLFRGRPYGPAIIFQATFTGVANEQHTIWTPQEGYFEVGLITLKGSAAADLSLCDNSPTNIIGFVDVVTTQYTTFDPGMTSVRGGAIGGKLILLDTVGVATIVRGVIYGWTVTRDGFYR